MAFIVDAFHTQDLVPLLTYFSQWDIFRVFLTEAVEMTPASFRRMLVVLFLRWNAKVDPVF